MAPGGGETSWLRSMREQRQNLYKTEEEAQHTAARSRMSWHSPGSSQLSPSGVRRAGPPGETWERRPCLLRRTAPLIDRNAVAKPGLYRDTRRLWWKRSPTMRHQFGGGTRARFSVGTPHGAVSGQCPQHCGGIAHNQRGAILLCIVPLARWDGRGIPGETLRDRGKGGVDEGSPGQAAGPR